MSQSRLSWSYALLVPACALLSLGSSSKSGDSSASAASSASTTSAATSPTVLATCTKKSAGECTENYEMVPTLASELCKSDEGTFATGSTPCPQQGVTGTCNFKPHEAGFPGEMHYYYANAVGDPKGSCEALGATWTAMAAPPAASAPKAASPAPPAAVAPKAGAHKK